MKIFEIKQKKNLHTHTTYFIWNKNKVFFCFVYYIHITYRSGSNLKFQVKLLFSPAFIAHKP
jgi:hypothetical protein